jgi:hypothetical protein
MAKGTVAEVDTSGATWTSRPGGVRTAQVGDQFVKEVDPNASWLSRWWGRTSLDAQALGLGRLGDQAPDFLYAGGRLFMQDAGRYTPGNFWGTWLRGSMRLGTLLNDIKPANIGSNGLIFDPVLPPIQELTYAGGLGLAAAAPVLLYRAAQMNK